MSNEKIRNSHPKESGLTRLPVSFKANYVMLGARKTVQPIDKGFGLLCKLGDLSLVPRIHIFLNRQNMEMQCNLTVGRRDRQIPELT